MPQNYSMDSRAYDNGRPKYLPGHTEHTDDCMSEWAEAGRSIMTEQTIAANHVLHMADQEDS